ncbi:MAG TPA: hypothetical protein VK463_11040 [Desulfomonilaceae bacterium]|nr:hypothetical protein [Desulfomonilaceae bacterium]
MEFKPGLILLGVEWLQVPRDGDEFHLSPGENVDLDLKVKVPDGTKFVHVSLLSSQMAFGSFNPTIPTEVGAIRHHIQIRYDAHGKLFIEDGYCSFKFHAVLQDSPTLEEAGAWSCFFILEVMCFGNRPGEN